MLMSLVVLSVLMVALLTLGATSVRSVSRMWLRNMEGTESDAVEQYLEEPARLLHAAGTSIALIVFAGAALLAISVERSVWQLIAEIAIYLGFVVVFGQLLPRALARRWATQFLPLLMPVLRAAGVFVSPFLAVAGFVVRQVLRVHPNPAEGESLEGIEEMLREGALEEIGATEELAIISGVVQFSEKTARDVMTPRSDVFMLSDGMPAPLLAKQMASAAYSRVPIYHGSPDNITGMIHAFDVFREAGERVPALRPVTFTLPERPAKELLFSLLRTRRQLAIVRSADGVVLGIVTLEDLLEELVGDIRDEHDEPAPSVTPESST